LSADEHQPELMSSKSNGFMQHDVGRCRLQSLACVVIVGRFLLFFAEMTNKTENAWCLALFRWKTMLERCFNQVMSSCLGAVFANQKTRHIRHIRHQNRTDGKTPPCSRICVWPYIRPMRDFRHPPSRGGKTAPYGGEPRHRNASIK
jgi:hypothetical protein